MKVSLSDYVRRVASDSEEKIDFDDVPDKIKKMMDISKADVDMVKKGKSKFVTVYTFILKGHKIVSIKTDPSVSVGGDNLIISLAE